MGKAKPSWVLHTRNQVPLFGNLAGHPAKINLQTRADESPASSTTVNNLCTFGAKFCLGLLRGSEPLSKVKDAP
eukprot:SAG31_NODE_2502_length_5594_cov_3.175796_5_plen_74_part_00